MMHWFHQPALRWSTLALLLGVPWCVLLLLKKSLEAWVVHGAYWVLAAYLLAITYTLIWVFQRHQTYWVSWFRQY